MNLLNGIIYNMKAKYLLLPVLGIILGKAMSFWVDYRAIRFPEPDANIGLGIVLLLGLGLMWIGIIALPIMLIWWLVSKKNKVA